MLGGNSAGRRRQRRAVGLEDRVPKTQPKAMERESISAGDMALWFLAAFMALGLFLAAPKLGRGVTFVVLIAMLGCLIHPISQLRAARRARSKHKKRWWFLGAMTLASVL